MTSMNVVLAAGGTGGHLFPAFALAEELGRRGVAVDLVTDHRAQRYGGDFPARSVHEIPSATLAGRSPGAMFKTAIALSRGIASAHRLLGQLQPAAVMGFGGYPTFPPLVAARLRGIPTAIHEANAVMGRANRMLAGRVTAIATSFTTTGHVEGDLLAKTRVTGNPVRDLVVAASGRPYQEPRPDGPLRLAVFGGSQGARYFSEAVPPALALLPDALRQRLLVVQQAREEDVGAVEEAYARAGIRCELATFFSDLPARLADAHLVIARSGASTVAELAVLGRPAILVPLPHALDNDQLLNATRLAEAGGAWCIEQSALDSNRLARELEGLLSAPVRLAEAAARARAVGRPAAVSALADLVVELGAARAGS
ncbi:MAG: undecaprenyldiphospho-muramoylpentapeptide beta-N-acetylglucosaminyltransferase [Rhizobiales bacterium]|nr:undecaprenyldiphospho-muramoylpentapeptide beta-N-acetylglucosaminyltransferase [Hyphomicrobiales bacterium]